jgi:uncharacterized protein (UPF0335 family)
MACLLIARVARTGDLRSAVPAQAAARKCSRAGSLERAAVLCAPCSAGAAALGKRNLSTLQRLRKQQVQPMSDISNPSSDATYRVTADELRQFIERIERLDAEKKDLADQQKEVMAEAKGRGYDTKIIRKVISLRKREPDDIAEEEAVLEMYKEALGMQS